MARVKRGEQSHKRHKKVLAQTKGYVGRSGNCYRPALERLEKALRYEYRDRRRKKRDFRSMWIQRINAAARLNGLTYSQLMNGIKKAGIEMDRKVLADVAARDMESFNKIADQAKKALEAKAA